MARAKGGFKVIRSDPQIGLPHEFFDIVRQSGMRNVVSTNNPPRIRIHEGEGDFVVERPGATTYILSDRDLPQDEEARAAAVLHRLAVAGDWAASEIIGRHERDEERRRTGYHDIKPKLSYALLAVRRYVWANPGADAEEIAEATGVSVDEIAASRELPSMDRP
jgi:hypothetical protein